MIKLNIVNNSFSTKYQKLIDILQDLFVHLSKMKEWKNFKGEINLVLIDDFEIQVLNLKYRNKNEPTDVLSFSYLQKQEIESNTNLRKILGEIFIAKTRAIQDAQELQIKLQTELNKLLVHGFLHILGFDHKKKSDYQKMKKNEDLILNFYLSNKT